MKIFLILLSLAHGTPLCKDINLRTVPVSTQCSTQKGFDFELVSRDSHGQEFWHDLSAHIIWGENLSRTYNQPQARKYCAESTSNGIVLQLPSQSEFEEAEAHGFREVLHDMNSDWYWSSTPYPMNSDFAIFFNALDGTLGYDVFDQLHQVRCAQKLAL